MMGQQRLSGGEWLSTWYFGNGFNDDRPVLGPVIEGIQGQPVEVTLYSMMPHTIHFHGLDVDQANDGVPSTSGYVATHGGHGGGGHGGRGSGSMGMDFGRVAGYVNLSSPFTFRFVAPGERYDLLFTMPPTDDRLATVSYWDIRLRRVLGGVSTQISNT